MKTISLYLTQVQVFENWVNTSSKEKTSTSLKEAFFCLTCIGTIFKDCPFFTPAFSEENQFTVYGEGRRKLSLPKILEDQMQVPYFPVDMDTLFQAQIKFREVEPKQVIQIGDDITVIPFRLTHPNAALGYLLQIQEVRIAYVSDHEHEPGKISQDVLEMVQGVEVLIHDAQYSREELASGKRDWGHSAWEDVVDLALESQVKHLLLFHHDPDATDEQLNERQFLAQQLFPNTTVAREGLRIPLSQFVESRRGQRGTPN